jgi:predicted dehydrogenase
LKNWGVAVVGCGSIADFHLQAIREIENARLVGVSSRSEQSARRIGEREACEWTTDYREMLQHPEVDIVCLTTSSGTHGTIGLDVLEAGKHLLVEKPIAMSAKEAEHMIKTAEKKGLTLSVVSQRRFEEQHQIAKRVLANGGLGKLLLAEAACPFFRTQDYYESSEWRGTLAEDGGALMNQGIHTIDLLLWMAGPVRSVFGKTATMTHRMEAEDMGVAMLTFENGAFGTFLASTSIRPGFEPSLNFYGEKGSIKIEGMRIVHWTVPDVPMPSLAEEGFGGGGVADPRAIPTQYHKLQIIDFLHAISEGRKPAVTGVEGQQAVRLVEAIYQSNATGMEIHLGDATG